MLDFDEFIYFFLDFIENLNHFIENGNLFDNKQLQLIHNRNQF